MNKIKDITGVILAGGENRRMGSNKALLKAGNKTILEIMIEKMKEVFESVLISAADKNEYEKFGLPVIADKYKNMGPLSGIFSALEKSGTQKIFFISCDMPLISTEMIRYIAEYQSDKPIILPQSGVKIHSLCGIFTKDCLPYIEQCFESVLKDESTGKNKCSPKRMIDVLGAEIIDAGELPFYFPDVFFNINTPDDYEKLIRISV